MARTYISVLVLQKNTAKSTIYEIQWISCMKSGRFHVKSGRFHAMVKSSRFHGEIWQISWQGLIYQW